MKELSLLKKLEKVKAPPDFEQSVIALLSTRKERRRIRTRNMRLSFAGSFAFLIVFLVILNVFILQKGPQKFAEAEKAMPIRFEDELGDRLDMKDYIPIIEVVDYSEEMKSLSQEPKAIYILEQVSDEYSEEIRY